LQFEGRPGQTVHETLSRKIPSQKRIGGVAQVIGPEFKPQYHQKKKRDLLSTVAHAYYPSYSGGREGEIRSIDSRPAKSLRNTYLR
jgi:hypothetical protein